MWVAVLHLVFSTVLVVGPVHAQSTDDNEPPVLDLQVVDTGTAGDSQVFSATVTDNEEVSEVVLYLRVQGAEIYESVPMNPIPGTSIYTVTVDITTTDSTVLEYYMNASDSSGNRVVRGFAFDPLLRDLMPANELAATTEPVAAPAPVPARVGISTGRKILYIGLGVLAVGALAAAASGGGGGGGDDMPGGGPVIPVLITVDPIAAF